MTARDDSLDALALERLTMRRYLLGMVCQGVWWSGYILFPFVLAKSLLAPGWLVTFTVVLESASMVLAIYWGRMLERGGRRRWLLRGGLGGRAVMVLMLLVRGPLAFTALLAVVYFFSSLVYPAQNGILQANIRADRRGEAYGRGALAQHLTAAAVSLLLGLQLDRDPQSYRWLYPLLGLVGFVHLLILARLPRPAAERDAAVAASPRPSPGRYGVRELVDATVSPFREAAATFRVDRDFYWFEINFMIYGIAYMMLMPVVPLYFTEELDLSYQQISHARVLIASLGVALLGPLMGRLMDRHHPVRLSSASYAALALYPLALAAGTLLPSLPPAAVAYAAFGVYAVAMAGVNVTWNVGSISFAPPGRGGYYQGVHVAMVGGRGLIGPLIGFAVLRLLGYREVFAVAAVIFLGAAFSSALLGRRLDRRARPAPEACRPPAPMRS